MIKRFFQKKLLLAIFLLALGLRIFDLGATPLGFHADEVRVGWNSYSILKTGEDDRGNKFALYYNTFGDYRPTGIFYLTIPSIIIFGNTEFAVRLPSALLGALTVISLFFLVKEFLRETTRLRASSAEVATKAGQGSAGQARNGVEKVALFASLLLAISPWHISTSRSTSEVVIAMFLALTGLFLFVRFINDGQKKFVTTSLLLLLASYFFYHSVRLLVPLFVGAIVVYYWKNLGKNIRKLVLGGFVILAFSTFLFSLSPEARGRFSQVSIFNDLDVQHELSKMPYEEGPGKVLIARIFHNKPLVYARRFVEEYGQYFSSNFLITDIGKPARYATLGVGVLTYIEFALFICGLIAISQRKRPILPLLLLLVAPIPAALTTEDSPNLHRALFMLPFIVVISSFGFSWLVETKNWRSVFSKGIFVLLSLNFIFYLHMYYVHAKVNAPLYRNVGAKELALKLNDLQGKYDKIILTNIPDDPYPWIAFFTNRDPARFNKDAVKREHGTWTTENLVFTGLRCPSRDAFANPDVEKLLVVDADGCATESNLLGKQGIYMTQIKRQDDAEVYTLWSTIPY